MMPLLMIHNLLIIITGVAVLKKGNLSTQGAPPAEPSELCLPSPTLAHSVASMPVSCLQNKD